MKKISIQDGFFFLILIALSLAFFTVIQPFIMDIFLAIILGVLFRKPYQFFYKLMKKRKQPAALVIISLVIITILIPLIFIGIMVSTEAAYNYKFVKEKWPEIQKELTVSKISKVVKKIPYIGKDLASRTSSLNAKLKEEPQHGELKFFSDGGFQYIPNENFVGVDKFKYMVSNQVLESNQAEVIIKVDSLASNSIPVKNHYYQVDVEDTLLINLKTKTTARQQYHFLIESKPSHGQLKLNKQTKNFSYLADSNFVGFDKFTYRMVKNDSIFSEVATVFITSGHPQTELPTANNDHYMMARGDTLTIPLERGVIWNDTNTEFNLYQFKDRIGELVTQTSSIIFSLIQSTFVNITSFIIHFFIILFLLYYIIIDGGKLLEKIYYLSPLSNEDEREFASELIKITEAIIFNTFLIGILEGLYGGILFTIFGIPSPFLWGIIMAILSMIPVVGANAILVPTVIIQFLIGNYITAILLLIFGVGGILVDQNLIRPQIDSNKSGMHPAIVFMASMGGLIVIGIVGFVIGPLIAALFIVIWNQFGKKYSKELDSWNNGELF